MEEETVRAALAGNEQALARIMDHFWLEGWGLALKTVLALAAKFPDRSVLDLIAFANEQQATWDETQRPRHP